MARLINAALTRLSAVRHMSLAVSLCPRPGISFDSQSQGLIEDEK